MDDGFHEDNVADNEHTDREQVQGSPLFAKLPAEIRLKIYEEIFDGSKTTYKQRLEVGDRTYHNVLLPTNHHNFLLTCRQAYNEAQEAYWRNTILYGGRDGTTDVFFLRSMVPGPAKLHIKHIRGLSALGLSQRAHVGSVRGCLEEFKNLKTVGFILACTMDMQHWIGNVLGRTIPTIEEKLEAFLKFRARRFNPLIYNSGPAVICRLLFRGPMLGRRDSIEEHYNDAPKMCFYNYNTGKIFYSDDHIDDEEACFSKVLDNRAAGTAGCVQD